MKQRIIIISVVLLLVLTAVLAVSGVFQPTETIEVASGMVDEDQSSPSLNPEMTTEAAEPEEDNANAEYIDSPDASVTPKTSSVQSTPKPSKKPVIIEVPDENNSTQPTPTPTHAKPDSGSSDSDDIIGRISF